MESKDIIQRLQAPFPASAIKWRIGRRKDNLGQALPYIDARDVQERLDEVVGPQGWEVTMKPSSVGIIAGIRILIDGNWVLKEDGAQFDNFRAGDVESNAKELAIKGAFSDAFKRAAVMWGIARYLYAYKAPFVEVADDGSFTPPTLPAHMLPEGEAQTEPERVAPETVAANDSQVASDTKVAEQAQPSQEAAQKVTQPAAAVDDDRQARMDRMVDEVAAQGQAPGVTEPQNPTAQAQVPAAQGNAQDPYDFSHLTLTPQQEANVREMLEKVKKLAPAVLKNFLRGPAAKAKLGEAAAEWLMELVLAREAAEQKAA